ncbi:MAG TPA: tRNA (5-methylaminomethyl-2-thiouridine)(34)-methyltransferase MnmD, partial [Gammaproteobacteria bacterium]|nr:tRNA (5-methylaminomethyl-2-thiouridine)(34)-methyltransferase MnmD [Gammaproteobacteria bacterium]
MATTTNNKISYSEFTWDDNGRPRSVQFDDQYFCKQNGLSEFQHVFCEGNELRARWESLPKSGSGIFTIAEAGFGTGLNFLCTLPLWQEYGPPNWTLLYVSIDQFPLCDEDLNKALKLWPQLSDYARALTRQYSTMINQNRQASFLGGKVKLTLITKHVLRALDDMRKENNRVDAWYLDGFAPSKNPEMWSGDVFAKMALLSGEGTTVSTYTAAGFVRRGLIQNGFKTTR